MPVTLNHHSSASRQVPHHLTQVTKPVPLDLAGVSRGFLVKAVRAGASLRGLSRVLNISVHYVYQLCLHYGLSCGKNMPPDLASALHQQAAAGASPVQLAQQHGLGYYRVMAMLKGQNVLAGSTGESRMRYRDHRRSRRATHRRQSRRAHRPQWRKDFRPAA